MGAVEGGTGPDLSRVVNLPEFIDALVQLRAQAGSPSYRTLAKKTGLMLRPPREISFRTVADMFDRRRRRLDLDLTVAIVRALGVDEGQTDAWRQTCIRVHAAAKSGGPVGVFRQLPADSAGFIGRESELARLREAVEVPDGARATVVISAVEGMAGVGKTQLAVHVAHALVRSGRYTDLQLYVNLRGFDPDNAPAAPAAVLEGFLRQLGVPGRHIPASLDERAAMFRDQISGKQALILLDNAADEDQVRPLIPADPGVLVLITSRRSLLALDGVKPTLLDVFTPAEAVSLLTGIAGAEQVEAEPEAAMQVAELCGFLPLALALAGAKLRSRPTWTAVDLLSYLRAGGLDTISAGSGRLQTVFDLSYRELPPHARDLYCLLGLHPGPEITVHGAAALAGTSLAAALTSLELLQDLHLLKQPIPGRYTFHDLLRRHARHMAEADVAVDLRREAEARLLDHCIAYSTAAVDILYPVEQNRRLTYESPSTATPEVDFGGPEAARAWLDAEAASLIAACLSDQAMEHPGRCQHLAAVLYRFLEVSGRHREAIAVHSAAVCGARERGDQNGEAKALTNRAGAHWHLGDYEQAVADNLGALGLYRVTDADPRLVGQTLTNLGVAYDMLARHDEALDCATQAVALFEEAADHASQAAALHNLASVKAHAGNHEEALACQAHGLALARDVGDPILIAYSLSALGSLHLELGRRAEARDHLQAALALADDNGHQALLLTCLNSLGAGLRADDPVKALDHHHKALAIATEVGDRFGQATARRGLGDSFHDLGDRQQARQQWSQALEIMTAINARGVGELRAKLGEDDAIADPDARDGVERAAPSVRLGQ